ncbi:hypothetical protein ABK040_012912 [Willaertia magna]
MSFGWEKFKGLQNAPLPRVASLCYVPPNQEVENNEEGCLCMFGGDYFDTETNNSCIYLNDIHLFDLKTKQWLACNPKGNIPERRFAPLFHIPGSRSVLIFGGHAQDKDTLQWKYYNNMFEFNVDTKEWNEIKYKNNSDIPSARLGGMVSFQNENNNYALLFGGETLVDQFTYKYNYYNELYLFDIEQKQWKKPKVVGDIPSKRWCQPSIIQVDIREGDVIRKQTVLVVFGGIAMSDVTMQADYFNDLFVCLVPNNPVSDEEWVWIKVNSSVENSDKPPSKRFCPTCSDNNSKVYVYGGHCVKEGIWLFSNELFELNLIFDEENVKNIKFKWTNITKKSHENSVKENIPEQRWTSMAYIGKEDILALFGGAMVPKDTYGFDYFNDIVLLKNKK